MLLHVSMPADDCRNVAAVLAAMMDGRAMRFPPGGRDAWNVWANDDSVQIVVTPRGNYMVQGDAGLVWKREDAGPRASETHFALAVARPAAEVLAIAEDVGWPAQVCDRGGFFQAIELWVEGAYLIELLDPSFAADYRREMTLENWQKRFG